MQFAPSFRFLARLSRLLAVFLNLTSTLLSAQCVAAILSGKRAELDQPV